MVGGLRVCFPKAFEHTLICCSVCRPRLTLSNRRGLCIISPKIGS